MAGRFGPSQGFKAQGLEALRFRSLRLSGLAFRVLRFSALRFRGLGFRVLPIQRRAIRPVAHEAMKEWIPMVVAVQGFISMVPITHAAYSCCSESRIPNIWPPAAGFLVSRHPHLFYKGEGGRNIDR